ncbi:MAG: mechanosensitive ion channel family protein [Clostridia bacterium]|nr:mechanosensitive ion channel family protein [Clostridia bacterium]
MNFTELLQTIGNWITTEGLKLVIVLIALFIFCKVINLVTRRIDRRLEQKKFDETLRHVLIPVVRRTLKVILFVVAIGYLGFQTSAISAAILSIGTAIGLALQGSLSNFAGGLIVVALRPYKIGDYITVDTAEGTVTEITLFYTYLTTPDNKVIILPNSKTSNTPIVNYSKNKTRRSDIEFSISYEEDFEKARAAIQKVMDAHDKILQDPTPVTYVSKHADSSIVILARYWTKTKDYWPTRFDLMAQVKKEFDEQNITIPFPQLDVHMDQVDK